MAKTNQSVRFDPEYKAGMRERAKALGVPLSEYVRNGMRYAEAKGFKGVLEA
jgi:hypothetical protein